jgi:hypothetical protein
MPEPGEWNTQFKTAGNYVFRAPKTSLPIKS